jgi:chromosomal replication initiation ATPase DnaA
MTVLIKSSSPSAGEDIERAKVEIGPQEIICTVARMYKVGEAEVLRGNRGRENEARKVAMYLVRLCL